VLYLLEEVQQELLDEYLQVSQVVIFLQISRCSTRLTNSSSISQNTTPTQAFVMLEVFMWRREATTGSKNIHTQKQRDVRV